MAQEIMAEGDVFESNLAETPLGATEEERENAEYPTYADWLFGFLDEGGVPERIVPYLSPSFVVLTRDAEIPARHGANLMEIIVPEGVNATLRGGRGHNKIHYMDGFDRETSFETVDLPKALVPEVLRRHPNIVEEMPDEVGWYLQAFDPETGWESKLTQEPTKLLHAISEYTFESEGSIRVREVLCQQRCDELEIVHSRRVNASDWE